ncbi:hypothetical protein PanWU01x14_236600 [Parasponia andersonii]|uniref:Secreted protein n=1 Tax=Parasponia andersonii TaxID=3476 RepID=A0A2P5BI47_PARAD|nr:hypothetical protein PanWU01x14_236600 [Parasponia andersonii]
MHLFLRNQKNLTKLLLLASFSKLLKAYMHCQNIGSGSVRLSVNDAIPCNITESIVVGIIKEKPPKKIKNKNKNKKAKLSLLTSYFAKIAKIAATAPPARRS